jgi:hypothetical protein
LRAEGEPLLESKYKKRRIQMAEKQLAVYNQFKIGYERLLQELGECNYTKKALDNLNAQLELYNVLNRKGTE